MTRGYISSLILFFVLAGIAVAYQPTGSLEELFRFDDLPLLRDGVKCKMFSSYDRTGGNNDGFNGTYSKLRVEDGNSVIAEMEGPGGIQRIWFTHSVINKDGLLNLKGEHIMIYLDGKKKPAVDVPLEKLFSGELEQFPSPLVGSGIGGFYCYVPIPYRKGCKVVIEGTGVRFYQVTYNEFPSARGVKTFSMKMTSRKRDMLAKAVKAWASPGDLTTLEVRNAEFKVFNLDLKSKENQNISLPEGEYMVRAIYLKVDDKNTTAAMKGKFAITWDGAGSPAVDLPFAYLFGQAFSPEPYKSLLMGVTDEGYYNFMPMPYRKSADIKITAEEGFKGVLTVVIQPSGIKEDEFAWFHANYDEQLPTEDGLHYPWLNTTGKGHYLGTYLVTEAKGNMPVWLEGDDKFIIDDELVIHGTGSEDYFNCGWYAVNNRLNRAGALPLHGFPVYGTAGENMRAVAYRWHLTDPVPYSKSISAKIEHGPGNDWNADYRSAVFFYHAEPVKVAGTFLSDDDCIDYLSARIWQLAADDPDVALLKLDNLYRGTKRNVNKIMIEGLTHYIKGLQKPSDDHIAGLEKSLAQIQKLIDAQPKDELYEKPEIKLPTDDDNLIPGTTVSIKRTLDRALYDLKRKSAVKLGFRPGNEIIIEARDEWGDVTKEPHYSHTEDFTNSYAKVDDVYLFGKGARFTPGSDEPSWARFTPDFPEPGNYEVFIIFSYGSNASNTKYVVKHADGEKVIPFEQRGRPGTENRNNRIWHSLGTYRFEKGLDAGKGSVTLQAGPKDAVPNANYDYRAYADSVRFVYKGK